MLVRRTLHVLVAALGVAMVGCHETETTPGSARLVATAEGRVEVRVEDRVLFVLAARGPVARTFSERPTGIGAIVFERSGEVHDPLHVTAVRDDNHGIRIDYTSATSDRTATLRARVVDHDSSEFALELAGSSPDSIAVAAHCDPDGTFHGLGEQYNATNQRGEAFPLLVNEQGNGRTGGPGVAIGDEHTTYFPMPYYLDARGFGVLFDTARRVNVDLCATDTDLAWFEVLGGRTLRWTVFHGPTPLDVVRQLGDVVGRPAPLPPWAFELWIGAQGGREKVLAEVDALEAAGIPVGALWVQDWGGRRVNPDGGIGVQYVWQPAETCGPEPNAVCYPDFAGFVDGLHRRGYKFLAYVNPFIVSDADPMPPGAAERFAEMEAAGLLVKDASGATLRSVIVPNFPQRDAHPDFSNPATLPYIKQQLGRIVTDYGVDGWMADFGEWLPFDGVFADGSDPFERHNTFPIDWQRATREMMEELRPDGDWAMIARSGWTGVQGVAMAHWVGDQETNWSTLDGLPTVPPALINLGLAAQPYVTHDIAGFTRGTPSTKELYLRWTELGAFTPIMRTHEGADKDNNWSWETDAETTAHFRRFTFVHCALRDEFMQLADEAQRTSAPILRHMMLVFPDDRATWNLSDQFMIGDTLLVAPILSEGAASRSVYFPAGTWFNVWTGEPIEGGRTVTVAGPIGSPPVFARGRDRSDLREAENALAVPDCRPSPP